MANTKFQFKYGQYDKSQAIEMSKVAGSVIYSGNTRGIYVDGKEFVSGEGADKDIQNIISLLGAVKNDKTGLYELSGLTNLPTGVNKEVTDVLNSLTAFRTDMVVEEYAQATIEADEKEEGQPVSKDSSKLTIFGIGQGVAGADNDGKIYHGEEGANDLVINIAGAYDADKNRIATEDTVDYKVRELRAEIFGTLNPEELDKTMDTIKEIQELMKGGNFVEWTHDVVNPETGETETKVENVRVEPIEDEDGKVIGYKLPGEDGTQVVTVKEDGTLEYADGYDKLQETQNVEELLDDINNIENAELVAKIEVAESEKKKFVTTDTEVGQDANGLRTTIYTIGVNYGTFKTGHGNVMDAESTAFVDGIATVEAVQKYIEERLCWDEFISSATDVANEITNTPGETYELKNDAQVSESLVIE